jgi:hypothetical protein
VWRLVGWAVGLLVGCFVGWLCHRLTGCLFICMPEWRVCWLVGWLVRLVFRSAGWFYLMWLVDVVSFFHIFGCTICWLVRWLVGTWLAWLLVCLPACVVGCFNGSPFVRGLFGWLVTWLFGCLVGRFDN